MGSEMCIRDRNISMRLTGYFVIIAPDSNVNEVMVGNNPANKLLCAITIEETIYGLRKLDCS